MACPYFEPGERLPLSSGSLGDLYSGCCNVNGESWQPDDQTVSDRCNLGYARGRCSHFPVDEGPDSVRFSVSKNDGSGITILYALERDHHPISAGALQFSAPNGVFAQSPSAPIEKLATAYVRSYLRRSR